MISVIIPVLNEEKAITQSLTNLLANSGGFEVIVVDGGSNDSTCDLVTELKNVKLIRTERGRAKQMNAGAKFAQGDWLCFLHADTFLPDNAINKITGLSETSFQAGCFHQRFSADHYLLRLISRLHNWRFTRTRVMYGDQTIFIRRELFLRLGG